MAPDSFNLYFTLLNLGLRIEISDKNKPVGFSQIKYGVSDQEWEDIYNIGVQQGVAAIQFIGLQQLADTKIDLPFQMPDRKLKMKWFAHAMQVENHCKSQFNVASELADIYICRKWNKNCGIERYGCGTVLSESLVSPMWRP